MNPTAVDFTAIDQKITALEETLTKSGKVGAHEKLFVGVDLGTAYIVVVVLNSAKEPVACAMEFAQVIRDGLVVDYMGASRIVKKLVSRLEERLGRSLDYAAIAVPPGTGDKDSKTHCYVVEGSGLEVTNVLDEPTAANAVLGIKNGVVVDIGGGTTGLAIFKDGRVIYTADEATGGTHLSLVIAGNYGVSFEEAEVIKKDKGQQDEIFAVVRPVIQKMASIVENHIMDRDVSAVYLVGGTCCLKGMERVFEKELGKLIFKPANPFLVTPLGIAASCDR